MKNTQITIGNIGDIKAYENVTCISVAVNSYRKDKDGEKQKTTEWIKHVLFGESAKNAAEILSKGSKVFIEGKIRTRDYMKGDEKHYATEVVISRWNLIKHGSSGCKNRSIIVGHIGADPVVRQMNNGKPVVSFSVACNEVWKDKDGRKQERTEWIKIVIFGDTNAAEILKKGQLVYIEGRFRTRNYTDKNGIKRYVTEIICQEWTLAGNAKGDDSSSEDDIPPVYSGDVPDDIPF